MWMSPKQTSRTAAVLAAAPRRRNAARSFGGNGFRQAADVADAFYDKREKGFVNGLLDAVEKDVRG